LESSKGWSLVQIMIGNASLLRLQRKFGLHPLIHTLLKFNLAQDVENCQEGGVEAGSVALMAGGLRPWLMSWGYRCCCDRDRCV
jgi:hypothetical protein